MVFPVNMIYTRWEFGWQPAGASADIEIQDFGIWFRIPDPVQPPFPGWNNVVNDFSQRAANAWMTNMTKANFASAVKFRRCVTYHYDQPHKVVLDRGESTGTQGGPWAGAGAVMPPENTVCVSLYGFDPTLAVAQARRKRGRIYLPTVATDALAGDGRLGGTYQDSIGVDVAEMFSDLRGTFDNVEPEPVITSVAGQFVTPITWARVGRRIDTQRRRSNRIPEAYINVDVA